MKKKSIYILDLGLLEGSGGVTQGVKGRDCSLFKCFPQAMWWWCDLVILLAQIKVE